MADANLLDSRVIPAAAMPADRRRFALGMAAAFTAVSVVAAASLYAIHTELTASALSRRTALATLAATTLAEKFDRTLDVGVALATRVRFRELIELGQWADAALILSNVPRDLPYVDRIGLVARDGALVAGVPEVLVPGRQNRADFDWFRDVMRDGRPHLSRIYRRPAAPQVNIFVAAVPIRSGTGDLLGVMSVQMEVERFFSWLRGIDIGAGGTFLVVDRAGTAAYRPGLPANADAADLSGYPAVQAALAGRSGVDISREGNGGVELVAAYSPVGKHGWGVVAAQPAAEVFRTRNLLLALAAGAYLLVAACFLVYLRLRFSRQRERIAEERRLAREALQRHAERLRVLHGIDKAILQGRSPQDIAGAVVQPLRELLGVPRAIVNLIDARRGDVEWLAAAGRQRTHVGPGVRFPARFLGETEALARGEPQVIDTRRLPPGPEVDALVASGVHVYMAVPMISGGELIGAISFGGETGVFPPEQVTIAEEVAAQLAIAISQARLVDRVQRHSEELEARVRERTAELEAFSYSVSHDLRAPLRAVDGFAGLLEREHAAQLDAEGRRLLAVVRASAVRMGRLVDDLLNFSRVTRLELAPGPLDMRELAASVVAELSPQHPAARVDIGELPPAKGDHALLRQVFVNLVGNALKYSAKVAEPRVEIGGRAGDGVCEYWVRDNGAGFDPRYAGKLFGVFQRLHGEEQFEGTGVGLAIVQRVVARHGGRVRAEGEVGRGATFTFSLPA